MVHISLREIGAFIPSAHVGCRRRNVQNEEEVLDTTHANSSIITHEVTYETSLSQSAVWHTLHEQQYPFHVQLAQVLQVGDNYITSSFDGFYTKLQMNLTLCHVQWTHKEWSKQSPQTTLMGNGKFCCLLFFISTKT
jgi:predicted DNA-binding transcriptional regulator AlpA